MVTLLQASFCGGAAFALCLALFWRPKTKRDGRQPESVPPIIPIPVIGHALGLLIYRNHYYTKISQRWNLPIVSLSLFGGKVHVISSPDLIYSIQKQPKSLSFWHFEAHFTAKLGGLSAAGTEECFKGIGPEAKGDSTLIDTLKAGKIALSPQGDLDKMSAVALAVLCEQLETWKHNGKKRLDLWAWVEHEVLVATTDGVYGPGNPYRDPKAESSFWNFANAVMLIPLPGILPKLLARKGIAARERVVAAINQYYASGGLQTGSKLPMVRYNSVKHIMPDGDIARTECTHGLAIMGNIVPAAFWTVFHVFSDLAVLEKVRTQVEEIAVMETVAANQAKHRVIDRDRLKDAPILLSVIQETLRYRARGTGPRMVQEDVTLSDNQREYHIEKDSVVMIAHEAMHYNEDVWGENANQFVAERFLPGNKIPTNAFRGFGGGANMCPGKSLATNVIAGLVAMLAMQFDLEPADGKWIEPGQDQSNMARENTPPLRKTFVNVIPRPGMDKVRWKFSS